MMHPVKSPKKTLHSQSYPPQIRLCNVILLTYTVTDRRRLQNIMGCEGGVTDDDPVCPSTSVILIQTQSLLITDGTTPRSPSVTHQLFCVSPNAYPFLV